MGSSVGHELQHAAEVLSDPSRPTARCATSLEWGPRATRSETLAAIDIGLATTRTRVVGETRTGRLEDHEVAASDGRSLSSLKDRVEAPRHQVCVTAELRSSVAILVQNGHPLQITVLVDPVMSQPHTPMGEECRGQQTRRPDVRPLATAAPACSPMTQGRSQTPKNLTPNPPAIQNTKPLTGAETMQPYACARSGGWRASRRRSGWAPSRAARCSAARVNAAARRRER